MPLAGLCLATSSPRAPLGRAQKSVGSGTFRMTRLKCGGRGEPWDRSLSVWRGSPLGESQNHAPTLPLPADTRKAGGGVEIALKVEKENLGSETSSSPFSRIRWSKGCNKPMTESTL